MSKFICPHWLPGQGCRPYFRVHWGARLFVAILGAALALATPALNFVNAISAAPPAAPLAWAVIFWGVLLVAVSVGSILLTIHHETDMWGTFVASVGTPSLLVALITLPHLVSTP